MSDFTDRALAHLRQHMAPTSDLGRFFRATSAVRLAGEEGGPGPALDKLAAIRELRDRLGEEAGHGALAARRLGASWSQIGDALCISRQGAQQNWGKVAAFAGWERAEQGAER